MPRYPYQSTISQGIFYNQPVFSQQFGVPVEYFANHGNTPRYTDPDWAQAPAVRAVLDQATGSVDNDPIAFDSEWIGWGNQTVRVIGQKDGYAVVYNAALPIPPVRVIKNSMVRDMIAVGLLKPPHTYTLASPSLDTPPTAEPPSAESVARIQAQQAQSPTGYEEAMLVGLSFGDWRDVLPRIQAMVGTLALRPVAEPDNPYDPCAVRIDWVERETCWKLGHLARGDAARIVGRLTEHSSVRILGNVHHTRPVRVGVFALS